VKAYKKHHRSGFSVIGISLDKPNAEKKIAQVAKKLGMTWEQIYDGGYWDAKLAKANGIRSIPSAFLIDRSGKVRFSGRDARGENLIANIEKLLAEKQRY
jgi:peroxiredoxin